MGFMRPLSRIFRPEPAAPSAAPPAVEPAAPADELSARVAAIAALPDGEALRTHAGLIGTATEPPALVHAAQARVAQLIDAQTIDFSALRAATRNEDALLSIAGGCGNPQLLVELLEGRDAAELARLATEASLSRVRQLAAQRIVDPADLKQLLKQVRGKDKNVYKIVKQKCDLLRAEEQRSLQVESDVAAACASLERHSHRIYDAVYEASLEHFNARWQTLAAQAATDVRERAAHALERCREIIAEHHRHAAQLAERQAEQEAQRAAQAASLQRAQEEAQQREQAAAAAAEAGARAQQAEEEARAARHAAQSSGVRRISGLAAKAHGALREGDTARAAGLRRAIDEALPSIANPPAQLTRQLQQLDAKLEELKQWKDFAVAPKRAELIADMEALVGSSEEPRALANRIKQLQDDWKAISKGVVSDSQADWQRFHQAAEAAYRPCKLYFEAQAKMRQENLQQRQVLLERLRNFENAQSGEHPDWRAIGVVLREARQEWRRHAQVDRGAAAPLQQEVDGALARLQQRLDAWYARKVAEKMALIERARALAAKEGDRDAAQAAKHLQQLWKDVGAVDRDQEQSLWMEFRAQCDLIFARRHQAHSDHLAALEANKAAAAAICQEVEQVAALSGPALLEGVAAIDKWRAAFDAIGEMPRADQRGLRERFERALKLCQTRVAEMRARDKRQSFTNMLEAARHIHAYGYAKAQGAESAELEARKQAAESHIAGITTWPKGAAQLLKEAWQKAEAAVAGDLPGNEKALRLLCIRSEIFADQPTPAEDQPLRREHQMQRLTMRMSERTEQRDDDWETLALAWVRVGPVEPKAHADLLARFVRSR
jgi:hypothetical protein